MVEDQLRRDTVNGEADECHEQAENHDVADVHEELLATHVEARVEDDGWEEEVEED